MKDLCPCGALKDCVDVVCQPCWRSAPLSIREAFHNHLDAAAQAQAERHLQLHAEARQEQFRPQSTHQQTDLFSTPVDPAPVSTAPAQALTRPQAVPSAPSAPSPGTGAAGASSSATL